ncbi:C-Jun-amino-terminal kinase-interacting protein 4-like isoform X3 [Gigantopelta aegis]|uniref:C-Jun-amino-terminal kinase-interacting protein 4-like isoform X3 n=1 Tax=Gigantopelta aegis TaxID=1735272 RepID=UPI001B88BF7D|nr:C-Jun-amino-terminal kinase-interacting protein 4-like isoform X3 [Gigantopelta aegis]
MAETVYGTNEEGHIMSEKVTSLANTVYQEFERMIKKYDEDVVKELMPLIVGILENLDIAYAEKGEIEVEIELLRDDNEQLLTQYEREKQLRKAAEQKYLEMEDSVEGEKKDLQEKIESLESIVRMLELKSKNAADHVSRLEEKEAEMKKEYSKLHERYTELFKTHMDYMERTKILMGTDKLSEIGSNARTRGGIQLPSLRPVSMFVQGSPNQSDNSPMPFDLMSPHSTRDSNISLRSELSDLDSPATPKENLSRQTSDKGQLTDNINVSEQSTTTATKHSEKPPSNTQEALPIDDVQMRVHPTIEPTHTQQTEPQIVQNDSSHVILKRDTAVPNTQTVEHDTQDKSSDDKYLQRLSSDDGFEEDHLHLGFGLHHTLQSIVASTPELDDDSYESQLSNSNNARMSRRNDNSIFDELSTQGADMSGDFGADVTDSGDEEKENDKDSVVSDSFFGMGKELENLILENTELLATKNALNVVKDDLIAKVDELTSEQEILREEINSLQTVKGRLQLRISTLEEELKKMKEEIEKKTQATAGDEEDDVPMAQRKRFTRVEMARVLMERNQYKERLMELQEAVRWTEMIRASREHPGELPSKKKSSIWNFFGNLFNSPNKPKRTTPLPLATVKYSAPTTQVQPIGDPNKKQREKYNLGQKSKAFDFLQDDVTSEKVKKERERERREQYKQVRAHVKKDDGRMQAYGWSLPAKFTPQISKESYGKSGVPVPVPVYCRPLLDKETGLKIWCAAGVNLTGGKTRDGGSIVGASIFYSNPPEIEQEHRKETKDEVEKLNQELKDHEKNLKVADKEQLSSLVWICTSTHSTSRVTVIDANNPGDILDSFRVSSTHLLCISSVPGAMESDYPVAEEILHAEVPVLPQETVVSTGSHDVGQSGENSGIGGITFVQCSTGLALQGSQISPVGSPHGSKEMSPETDAEVSDALHAAANDDGSNEGREKGSDEINKDNGEDDPLGATVFRATGSPPSSGTITPSSSTDADKPLQDQPDIVRDGLSTTLTTDNQLQYGELEKMSSVVPTVWMGSQSGSLYVHSSVTQWKRCLHSVKLRDSILSVVHVKGRVLVALADGTVAIFHRASDGQWDLKNYHLLDLGKPHHSIRCMTVIAGKHVWCGYKNKIHIIDPQSMKISKSFDAHPRKESQVRQLAWVGDGVWISIRLDSTLRLYHAYTHQHLQDVDIEPYVSKMLGTGKLGFSFVRITAMLISCNRLWIGTGNGVIISVPLSESNKQQVTTSSKRQPGGVVRVYSDSGTDNVTPSSFIPYCSMAQAQLSFHGHKDAVKFFVAVPAVGKFSQSPEGDFGTEPSGFPRKGMSAASDDDTSKVMKTRQEAVPAPQSNTKLVLSGGEGYVDFRIGDGDGEDEEVIDVEAEEKKASLNKADRSHLIVWQVITQE